MDNSFSGEEIRKLVFEAFESQKQDPKAKVSLDSQISGDLGIDSLSVMETLSELEDKYDLTFEDEQLPAVRTVGDVIDLIEQELKKMGRLQ